ncbi:hypothetical protein Dda_8503 [Drechslerella dactyloides]|uniref:Uncharacterized protein n=1 Tax=Drechslerella dactyloides TaxID=74499 RepID=A0AAD6IQG0_DREDA|nr:hypothetical protein Dda_8503 [Drechslerella dactyloides]
MRLPVSAAFRLSAIVFCLAPVLITADIIRIAKADWLGYITENYQTIRAILLEIETFRLLRRLECSIGVDNAVIVNHHSLTYLLDTVDQAAAKFSQSLKDIESIQPVDPVQADAELAELGVANRLEAQVVGLRLRTYRYRLAEFRAQFLDIEDDLDTIPNRVFPTIVLDDNLQALADYIYDARDRGGNYDTGVIDIDTDAPQMFLEFFTSLVKEAGKAVDVLQAAEEYSELHFGQAFTDFIADRDPMALYQDPMEEERAPSTYTLGQVFYEMQSFFQCWQLRSERIADLLPTLTEIPAYLEAPYWTQMTDLEDDSSFVPNTEDNQYADQIPEEEQEEDSTD